MDGVICSNHGGRQLDGAVSSLEMLPEIADAVRGKKTALNSHEDFAVLFDSGVRTGVDIIKALSLGAKAVLVGRPWVYGLGINGKHGARDVMRGMLADLDQSMGLAGIRTVADCSKGRLRKVQCAYHSVAVSTFKVEHVSLTSHRRWRSPFKRVILMYQSIIL